MKYKDSPGQVVQLYNHNMSRKGKSTHCSKHDLDYNLALLYLLGPGFPKSILTFSYFRSEHWLRYLSLKKSSEIQERLRKNRNNNNPHYSLTSR